MQYCSFYHFFHSYSQRSSFAQCLAAHLLRNATDNPAYYSIEQTGASAFIKFGPTEGETKLDIGSDITGEDTSYIFKPNPDSTEAIGYEGE